MSDQLRKLAETAAESVRINTGDGKYKMSASYRRTYADGFIAGRTSVTHADIERVILGRTATAGARAVLALLTGDTDD